MPSESQNPHNLEEFLASVDVEKQTVRHVNGTMFQMPDVSRNLV